MSCKYTAAPNGRHSCVQAVTGFQVTSDPTYCGQLQHITVHTKLTGIVDACSLTRSRFLSNAMMVRRTKWRA